MAMFIRYVKLPEGMSWNIFSLVGLYTNWHVTSDFPVKENNSLMVWLQEDHFFWDGSRPIMFVHDGIETIKASSRDDRSSLRGANMVGGFMNLFWMVECIRMWHTTGNPSRSKSLEQVGFFIKDSQHSPDWFAWDLCKETPNISLSRIWTYLFTIWWWLT